jgi:16S rRNA (guanine527-N7)-methyltransferase
MRQQARKESGAGRIKGLRAKLSRRARRVGLNLSSELMDSLESYFELLRLWNRRVSLTSLPVEEAGDQAIDRLLIEPVLAAKYLPGTEAIVIDIGSGGGSPAIPMKLAAPGISLRMVEAKARKTAFLRELIRHLSLEGVEIETARFEQLLARPELHESADVVTLRAVRVEGRTLLGMQAFLKPGGRLFLFRSSTAPDAQIAIQPPLAMREAYPLVDTLGSRLVILEKLAR